MRFLAVFTLFVAMASGCSASDTGGMPDAGFTINGHPFTEYAEGAGQVLTNGDVTKPAGYIVELYASASNGCQLFMSTFHDEAVLQFHFPQDVKVNNTYDVNIGNTVFSYKGDQNAATPSSGKLTVVALDTMGSKHIAGTYDVTFVTKEHLSGVFDAPLCE